MKFLKIFLMFFLGFVLSNCATKPMQQNFSDINSYQLWNLENSDLYSKSYIFFDKAPLGGFYLGCNRFNFIWKAEPENKSIFFDNIMSTRMACERNIDEQTNVEKLMRVNKYKIEKNKMQLFEDDELLFNLVLHSKSDSFFNLKKPAQKASTQTKSKQEPQKQQENKENQAQTNNKYLSAIQVSKNSQEKQTKSIQTSANSEVLNKTENSESSENTENSKNTENTDKKIEANLQ